MAAVVLLGPPGAGKSTAGRLAAQRAGLAFADLDDEIAALRGRPVADVFRDGEALFRALELYVLPPLLRRPNVVVAAGAGVVDGARARALLAALPCVLIDVPAPLGLARVGAQRPWLDGAPDPLATYRARERVRRPLRAELARARVSGAPPLEAVVSALAKALLACKPLAQSSGA